MIRTVIVSLDVVSNSIEEIKFDANTFDFFKKLKENRFKLGITSDWSKNETNNAVDVLEIRPFLDVILSNEDVINPKPHPEIYFKAFDLLNVSHKSVLVIEESEVGLKAARKADCFIWRIEDKKDINFGKINDVIGKINSVIAKHE